MVSGGYVVLLGYRQPCRQRSSHAVNGCRCLPVVTSFPITEIGALKTNPPGTGYLDDDCSFAAETNGYPVPTTARSTPLFIVRSAGLRTVSDEIGDGADGPYQSCLGLNFALPLWAKTDRTSIFMGFIQKCDGDLLRGLDSSLNFQSCQVQVPNVKSLSHFTVEMARETLLLKSRAAIPAAILRLQI